jgi:nitrous oxidase accessory protein NosD
MAQERLYLMNGSSNVISKNTFNGLFLGYPDSICSNNIFSGNAIKGPGVWGIWIGPQGTNNLFYANHIEDFHSTDDGGYYSDKDGGVAFDGNQIAPAANNTFYHNNFVNNKKSVDLVTDQIVRGNFWDDGKEGNYWDDYNGTDSGKDGIGDTPYVINENNQDRYPLMAPFDVSSVTVELPEWASPSPTPIPTPIDAKPLPTTLLVAVAIVACVFGFGLIVNIVTGKRKSSNRQGN